MRKTQAGSEKKHTHLLRRRLNEVAGGRLCAGPRYFGSSDTHAGGGVFAVSVFAMVSNGVDTCEVAQCRFHDGRWRPLCLYGHSGRSSDVGKGAAKASQSRQGCDS